MLVHVKVTGGLSTFVCDFRGLISKSPFLRGRAAPK